MRTAAFLVLLAACSGSDDDPCGEPDYQGNATDEAWRTMLDGEARASVGDPEAVTITAPGEGQVMPASAGPMLISWSSPIAKVPHLPPITGDVYLVRITVPGRECPLALLTTDQQWQLEAGDWDVMRTAGGTFSVSILSAYLTENRITEGPYRPTDPRTFSIGP